MNTLTRYSAKYRAFYPTVDGKYVLFADVEMIVRKMERRHKLAMDKLRASTFNTGGTISGRFAARAESPGSVRRMTKEQIVEQTRGCRLPKSPGYIDPVKFAADIKKVVSLRRLLGNTIQFEELEL